VPRNGCIQILIAEAPRRIAGTGLFVPKYGELHAGAFQQCGEGATHLLVAPVVRSEASDPVKRVDLRKVFDLCQLLDMTACLECGRCMINCPTATTGKALNPKYLVIEQREHLLAKAPALLAGKTYDGSIDASQAQKEVRPEADMIRDVATDQAVWDCTNCGWCEEGRPVGIEHIRRIDDMRRNLVMMESRFPHEIVAAFKGIETQGNPWGLAQDKRADWAEGLRLPLIVSR